MMNQYTRDGTLERKGLYTLERYLHWRKQAPDAIITVHVNRELTRRDKFDIPICPACKLTVWPDCPCNRK
jgi:hypothetical protein